MEANEVTSNVWVWDEQKNLHRYLSTEGCWIYENGEKIYPQESTAVSTDSLHGYTKSDAEPGHVQNAVKEELDTSESWTWDEHRKSYYYWSEAEGCYTYQDGMSIARDGTTLDIKGKSTAVHPGVPVSGLTGQDYSYESTASHLSLGTTNKSDYVGYGFETEVSIDIQWVDLINDVKGTHNQPTAKMRETIRGLWDKTVGLHAFSRNRAFIAVDCSAFWKLFEFCSLQGTWELRPILTISGTKTKAQAVSCEEYVGMIWPDFGLQVVDTLTSWLATNQRTVGTLVPGLVLEIKTLNPTDVSRPASIIIMGAAYRTALVLEILAWCAAVFRPPISEKNLSLSRVSLELRQSSYDVGLKLSLAGEELKSKNKEAYGTCWYTLFPACLLAYGFPIMPRGDADGLEIPFALMRRLAAASVITETEGKLVMYGHESILFPTAQLENGWQWHIVQKGKDFSIDGGVGISGLWPPEKAMSAFNATRIFLGCYPKANVNLGTQTLLNTSPVQDSGLRDAGTKISIDNELTLSAGFSGGGTVAASGKIRLTRAHAHQVDINYRQRLSNASRRPCLVYDSSAVSSWLVSEASLVLHMSLTYMKHPDMQEYRGDSPPLVLPFAAGAPDGGQAAKRTIDANEGLLLYREPDHTEHQLWNLVDGFLKTLAALRLHVQTRKENKGFHPFPNNLQGFDFNDLATKKEFVFERKLHWFSDTNVLRKSPLWSLAKEANLQLFYGRGFGAVIESTSASDCDLRGYTTIPNGCDMLLASKVCLDQLREEARGKGVGYYVSSSLVWKERQRKGIHCDRDVSMPCTCLQKFRTTGFLKGRPSNIKGDVNSHEAVAFGRKGDYHQRFNYLNAIISN